VLAAMYATYAWRLELAVRRLGGHPGTGAGSGPAVPPGPTSPATAPPEPGPA